MNPINRIGQKVVCIMPKYRWAFYGCGNIISTAPEYHKIYTVSGFQTWEDSPGVHLREHGGMSCGCANLFGLPWPINAFRPVNERKTDIEVFTRMLRKTDIQEGV